MVEIRSAQSHPELEACVDLQTAVWGFGPRDVVPFHQLLAAHEWGGQVLVAVDDGRIVGFSYGFAGRQYGRPALLSHMLAVLPDYRGQGLGVALKLAQGRWARMHGYDLVTWTYDPLEAANAGLNIARLGGVVRQYLVNHYGEMTDGLNRGLPSDRLLVEWHLGTRRVSALLDAAAGDGVLAGALPDGREAPPPAPVATVAIPLTFQRIKETDPAAALRWRLRVREQLTTGLAWGHVVAGFQRGKLEGTYLLMPEQEGKRAPGNPQVDGRVDHAD